ncbi:MAG: tol-pal system protein YbgF [Pseudomonadota bacterium]
MDFKKKLIQTVFFILISFSLVSCGSFDYFKPSSEPVQSAGSEDKITELESEILIVKQEQAELKTQIKEKDASIQKLEKDINTLEKKLTALEKIKHASKPANLKVEYTTPAELYKQARNLLLEEDYENAATLFEKFIATWPKDSLADNAFYWMAECHYSMGDYKKAILLFMDLEQQYPTSEKVPDAILKAGYSYLSLDDTNRAHHFLTKVLKKYPFSPAAEKAQEKLGEFK